MSIFNSVIFMSGGGATAGCSYSKKKLENDTISSRKKKSFIKSIKCPECSAIIEEQNLIESEHANVIDNLIISFLILIYSDFFYCFIHLFQYCKNFTVSTGSFSGCFKEISHFENIGVNKNYHWIYFYLNHLLLHINLCANKLFAYNYAQISFFSF